MIFEGDSLGHICGILAKCGYCWEAYLFDDEQKTLPQNHS
jgi:hypothetical protein